MPKDIDVWGELAEPGDRLMSAWINAVTSKVTALENQLALANQAIAAIQGSLQDAFRVSVVSGLNLIVAPGSAIIKSNGTVISLGATNLSVPPSVTSFVFLNAQGAIATAADRPTVGLELARVVTDATRVTNLTNFPRLEIRAADPNLEGYATIAYANSRQWKEVAKAVKSNRFKIPSTLGRYYTIPFEVLSGNGFNTAGEYRPTEIGRYIAKAQIRVDTLSPSTEPDLAVKLSLFKGNSELGLPLQQMESAEGDITLNAETVSPVELTTSDVCYLKVYLTRGVDAQVREGSVIQFWKLPD